MKTLFASSVFGVTVSAYAQTTLAIGDVSIVGFNSNAPDNFTFVTWTDLSASSVIKFTDSGFNSSSASTAATNARASENFVIWSNSTGATIAAGTVIRIEGLTASIGTAAPGTASGLTGISSSGDQLFVYQGTGTTGTAPNFSDSSGTATFSGSPLYLLNFGSAFLTSGSVSSNTTYLPSDLNVTNGNISFATSSIVRGEYNGSRTFAGSFAEYRSMVNNPANWTTFAGSGTITLDTTVFSVSAIPEPSTYAAFFGLVGLAGAVLRRRSRQ